MNVHPFADRFPMLAEDEMRQLADSIAANGLLNPIVTTPAGELLDGRNRMRACQLAGIEPAFTIHEGDPIAYVIASNVHRRHLSTGQRAMAVGIGLVEQGKRRDGRWHRDSVGRADIGEISNIGPDAWSRAMQEVGLILDHAPHRADEVMAGTVALARAYEETKTEIVDRRQAQERTAQLRDRAPDLAQHVLDDVLPLEEAWAAYEKRTEAERKAAEQEAAAGRQTATALAEGIAFLGQITLETSDQYADIWHTYAHPAQARLLGDRGLDATAIDRAHTGLDHLKKGLKL